MATPAEFGRERIQPNNDRQQALQDFRRQLDSDIPKLRNQNPLPLSDIRQIVQQATKGLRQFGIVLSFAEEGKIKNLLSRLNEEIDRGAFEIAIWRNLSYDAANSLQNIIKPALIDAGNILNSSYSQNGSNYPSLPPQQNIIQSEDRTPHVQHVPLPRHTQQLEEERARVENLLRERNEARARVEALLEERDKERREAWPIQNKLTRTQDELQRTKAELEHTKTRLTEALAGGAANRASAGQVEALTEDLAKSQSALQQAELQAQNLQKKVDELERISLQFTGNEDIGNLSNRLHMPLNALNSIYSPIPPYIQDLSKYAQDLVKLCQEQLQENIQPDIARIVGALDVLVYGAPPPITRLFILPSPSGGGNRQITDETFRDNRWQLVLQLMLTILAVQGWAHRQLCNKGVEMIVAARREPFNDRFHQRDERNMQITDDESLQDKVDVTLRHGYKQGERVIRPAVVRCFRYR